MKRLAVCAGLFLLVLITPSSQSSKFDGLPLGSPLELCALGAFMFLLGHQNLRQSLVQQLNKLSQRWLKYLTGLLGLLIIIKSLLCFTAPTSGTFEVCYQRELMSISNLCSRTFEPFTPLANISEHFERRSTTVDKIQFGSNGPKSRGLSQSNWRLPFINSWEFDDGWRMWNVNDKNIEVFPFRAEFRTFLKLRKNEIIRISYIGEGSVSLGDTSILLPAAYSLPSEVRLKGSAKSELLSIDYKFGRSESYGNPTDMPYAALSVDSGTKEDFSSLTPSINTPIRVLNLLTDLSIFALFVGALLLTRQSRAELRKSFLLVSIIYVGMLIGKNSVVKEVLVFEFEFIILVLLTMLAIQRRWPVSRLSPSYLVVAVIFVRNEIYSAIGEHVAFDHILIRLRGNDHFVYHAHVREMLTSGFLRGGEDVYYFQPGIRYYFYLQNILLGEGGFITGVMSVGLMGLGILVVGMRLKSESRFLGMAQRFGIVGLLIWWSSSHTTQSTINGLSEFGTWIVLIVATGLMLRNTGNFELSMIGVLAGIATWIRPNQGLAMIGLVVLAALLAYKEKPKAVQRVVVGVGTLLSVLLLMPLHNLIFGDVIAFQPVGAVVARQLTWAEIFGLFQNVDTQQFLFSNFQAAIYLPSFLSEIYSFRLALGFLLFFAVAVAVFPKALRLRRSRRNAALGILIVVGQLVPFLKFTIVRYHPIQIIAIHLSLVLMALLLSHRRETQGAVPFRSSDELLRGGKKGAGSPTP